MFGFIYKKAPPTVYVMHYKDGKVHKEGAGLSFFYFAPISTIVEVPISSTDLPFIFKEITADYQEVSFQGQLTYRIADPARLSLLLDFSLNARGTYRSEYDPRELLGQRLVNTTQEISRGITQHLTLQEVLSGSDTIGAEMLRLLRAAETIHMLGVEIVGLTILMVRPTPEMAKALEAAAREALQRQADQAIYARRNAAVEEERRIKESELNTEIAVENKKRQIRETMMQADIALEEQRASLIDKKVENERKDADSRAYALETTLKPLQDADWRTLLAATAKNGDPRFAISLAFNELAENAHKIGQLNVTPDLLQSLISNPGK